MVVSLALAAATCGASASPSAAPEATGRIVFVQDMAGTGPPRYAVAEADLARGSCRRLSTLRPAETGLLAPDGRSVAAGDGSSIRILTLGTGTSRLLRRGAPTTRAAAWSPDGRRLAYLERGNLRVIGADGRGDRRLARFAAGSVSWSPDGTRIAFASTTGNGRAGTLTTTLDVITITTATVKRRVLLVDPAPYGSQPSAAWSPHSSRLLVSMQEPPRILALPSTGGKAHILTRGSTPRWSPDGSRISFRGSGPAGIAEAWVMDADGSQKRRLTTSTPPPRGTPKIGSYPGPWSPDGNWLAYGRTWALATIGADGTAPHPRCPLPVGTALGDAVWVD